MVNIYALIEIGPVRLVAPTSAEFYNNYEYAMGKKKVPGSSGLFLVTATTYYFINTSFLDAEYAPDCSV